MNSYQQSVASAMDGMGVDPSWGAPPMPAAPQPNVITAAPTVIANDPVAQQAPAPTEQAPPQQEPRVPVLEMVSRGGTIPAHEATKYGPTQWAALDAANQATELATASNAERGSEQAARDEQVYMRQAQEARGREEAAAQLHIARQDELQQLGDDFSRQARQLSKERIDPDRLWASKSTPQKVASFISIALGGFLSGARGGENVAWQRVNEEIERDVKSQEFAYHAKRQGVEAAQNAYGMALQRYQSADAARSFARVAAMDAVAAEIQRQAAQNKGVDVKNRAMSALAELQQNMADQKLKGIAYVPSQYVAPTYKVGNRIGTYTGREIDANQIAPEEGRGHAIGMENLKGAWDVRKTIAAAEAKGGDDKEKRWVPTSSTGKGYFAPTEKEGVEHRETQAATQEVLDLVERIRANSNSLGYTGRVAAAGGVRTGDVKKVEADSVALTGALNRMNKFGALDKGTQQILKEMTGDPLSVMGNEANLDAIKLNAIEKRRQIEKSSTGAKPSLVPEGSTGGKQAW